MRWTLKNIVLLELYALLLVLLVMPGGVKTDEAKYLLSIPYPHPPVIRQILSAMKSFPYQEFLARLIFSSIVVQSVWFIRDLGVVLSRPRRAALVSGWLFSAAVILQSGTVMLTTLTAVFGLIFLWLAMTPSEPDQSTSPFIGLLWLFGLFSAFQTVLYFPLVWSAQVSARASRTKALIYVGVPILLLGLYSLTNPLVPASILKLSGQDSALPASLRFQNAGWIWLIAGSGVGSLIGSWGLIIGGRRDLQLSALVLGVYFFISSAQYYAILFTPLLIGGVFILLRQRKIFPALFISLQAVTAVILTVLFLPPFQVSDARKVMEKLRARGSAGLILIDGVFGHEWQYESRVPVRIYSPELSSDVEDLAGAIVCTKKTCEEQIDTEKWVRIENQPMEVWVRR
ncbi:hypothetical protein A3J34_03690 [Candidatus Peribacteria bacterium RIFCSPLOWO2_02_FULL_51_10]|nr:MAG: hypothetical protein A3J34_03690 [Candidatus Peribacteria bacterium RIFCSPLOWO2_02_FULL_51_10]